MTVHENPWGARFAPTLPGTPLRKDLVDTLLIADGLRCPVRPRVLIAATA